MPAEDRHPPFRSLGDQEHRPRNILEWGHAVLQLLEHVVRGFELLGPSRDSMDVDVSAEDVHLPVVSRALWIGTGGNVVVIEVDGAAEVTYPNVQDGTELHVAAVSVLASSTASDIRAMF